MKLGEIIIHGDFREVSLCRHVPVEPVWVWYFFGVMAMFSMVVCCLFPQCMLAIIPLIVGVADVMARACIRYWVGAPLCPVVVNALSGAVSASSHPVVGVETPRSISELWCKVDRIGVFPLREESLIIPLPELFIRQCTLLCHFLPIVRAYKIHSFWQCLWRHLNSGYADNCPGVCQVLFS